MLKGPSKTDRAMARRKPPAKSNTLRLDKIDVAEAHIISAVKLFFENGHPASVYTLASAAREIVTTLGIKQRVETLLHQMATWKGETLKQQIGKAHAFANFFKHANTDPTAVLEFPEDEVDGTLFIACHDDPKRTRLIRGLKRPRVVSDQRISRVAFPTRYQCDGVPVVTCIARTRQWQTIVDVAPVAERAAIAKTMQFR